MSSGNNLLLIRQLDGKLQKMMPLQKIMIPKEGWVNIIRKTLNMSLSQLGKRMNITPQSVRALELREKEGTLSLKSLKEAAEALNMRLVYGFVPKEDSLEKMVERKAYEMAMQIVKRTSITMKLEDQENSPTRIKQAISEMADELKREMSKKLWD
ncbi:mobile mystery protein A [Chitinophaga nivalis]|uniref:Mobile mystery protein A n=1 Tax=Chitinophaga nivalis TaxID=2991709 RepID=A0ABT3ISG7_9BACT|nr:mobile mystery protein A [Chitinophaga nivalis]MCW3463640.1 mobile mystery protein A [Chitinophaga nivalis]MCW3486670.1 mobile mystery protein A [Chitinophaga nivalis]